MAHVEKEEAIEVIHELEINLHNLCRTFQNVHDGKMDMTENQKLVHISKIHLCSQELLKWELL